MAERVGWMGLERRAVTRTMNPSPPAGWGRAPALVLAVFVIAAGCSGGSQRSKAAGTPVPPQSVTIDLEDGVLVEVPAGSLATGASVVRKPVPADALPAPTGFVGPAAVALATQQGELLGVIRVVLPVDAASLAAAPLVPDGPVPVLHQHGNEPPELLVGTLERARSIVTLEARRLSIFRPLLASVSGLASEVAQLFNGIFGEVVKEIPTPGCADERGARGDGLSITSTAGPTAKWCLGRSGGARSLTFVNGRRYPLVVSTSGSMKRTSAPPFTFAEGLSQGLGEALGQNRTVLPSGGSMEAAVTLEPGGKAVLAAEYDGFAHVLGTLQLSAELILAMASRMPFGKVKSVEEAKAAMTLATCVPAVIEIAAGGPKGLTSTQVGRLIGACFDLQQMVGGLAGFVVGWLGTVAGAVSFFMTSAQAGLDVVRSRSDYRVTVSRVGQLVLTTAGIGPLRIGMSSTDAIKTGAIGKPESLDGCATAQGAGPYRAGDFTVLFLDGKLARVYIDDGTSRALGPRGVKIGSAGSALDGVKGTRSAPDFYGGAVVQIAEGSVGYAFEIVDGKVRTFSAGTLEALALVEYCA